MMLESRMERKKAKTKETIFQTAVELFLQKGYDQTTVDEIAEKADVAKGTFFNYFPTKDAILYYLSEQRLTLLTNLLDEELKDVGTAKEKTFICLKTLAKATEDNKEITALIIKEIFKDIFSHSYFINEDERKRQNLFIIMLAEIFQEGQDRGEFRSEINPYYFANIFSGMYFFTLFHWLEESLSGSLSALLVEQAEMIMSGVLSVKR